MSLLLYIHTYTCKGKGEGGRGESGESGREVKEQMSKSNRRLLDYQKKKEKLKAERRRAGKVDKRKRRRRRMTKGNALRRLLNVKSNGIQTSILPANDNGSHKNVTVWVSK